MTQLYFPLKALQTLCSDRMKSEQKTRTNNKSMKRMNSEGKYCRREMKIYGENNSKCFEKMTSRKNDDSNRSNNAKK